MNRQTSPRYTILLFGGVAALIAAVVIGQPVLVALVGPLVAMVIVATALHRWPDIEIEVRAPARAVVGDEVDLVVSISSNVGAPWVEIELELPPDVVPVDGIRHAIVAVEAGQRVDVRFPVALAAWGVAQPGRVQVRARDRFGMFITSRVVRADAAIRVHPEDGQRRATLTPARLRARVGVHRSPRHGDGSEFAEVRPYRPGDPLRSLNWRVSARRGDRWVTVRHPDRSGDLVFLLDSFADLGPDHNRLTQRAVRATMALAEASLGTHDRVGVLDVGRHVRWFRPQLGRLHQARLLDGLLETQVEPGLRAPSLAQLPLHELSSDALIVMVSGLTDPDMAAIPVELRARGLDIAVLDCAAEDHMQPSEDHIAQLTARLWRLQRERRRRWIESQGVPVVVWRADQPVEIPTAALSRRAAVRR
ncbi:MAG: DUF58 domain-containing protein [Actinomycetota bacterium]